MSKNSVGLLNSESCHRPHNARTTSNAFILEDAGTPTTYVAEEVLCNLCHGK